MHMLFQELLTKTAVTQVTMVTKQSQELTMLLIIFQEVLGLISADDINVAHLLQRNK